MASQVGKFPFYSGPRAPACGHSQIDVKRVMPFRLGRPTSLEIGIRRTGIWNNGSTSSV